MSDIKITYETLYEFVRLEKSRPELQELEPTFFEDVLSYLKQKQKILDEAKYKTDIFSAAEKEKTATQIRNIKKLIKELYEKRESKIFNMAINKSRTDVNIVDTTNLLPEEKKLYECILSDLDIFRRGILYNILELTKVSVLPTRETPKIQRSAAPEPLKPVIKPQKLRVKFLTNVDKFFGKELEPYGPYSSEDVKEIPNEIAEVLVNNGQAVKVE